MSTTNKKTKQVKTLCNFTSFYEALTEMKRIGGMFYTKTDEWYNTDITSFLDDSVLTYLQQDYTSLYRLEDVEVNNAGLLLEFISKQKLLSKCDTLEDILLEADEQLNKEFIGLCKLVVEFSEEGGSYERKTNE